FFQAEDGIRDFHVTGVQTCALPISLLAGTALSLGMVAYGGQASAACVGPVDGVVTCSPGDYGSITYINPDDPTFELDVGEEGEETTITPPAGEHGIAVWHKIGRAHV